MSQRVLLPFCPIFFSLILFCPALSRAACISPNQAAKHIGETKCVSGRVTRIEQGNDGANYLEFCQEDGRSCCFAAVIFPEDLRHIGDVRQLQGKFIEVHGEIKEYERGPEIIVSDAWQLKGEASSIPPLPQNLRRRKERPL